MLSFIEYFSKDRCREYRELLWKDAMDNTNLSQYEKQRIQVEFIHC